jgi:glucosylceramidase
MRRASLFVVLLTLAGAGAFAQSPTQVTEWLTTSDRSSLLAEQPQKAMFHSAAGRAQANLIAVDDKQVDQTVDGFGVALTGGSAQLMMAMQGPQRKALLQELFGAATHDIGISYIRVTIGSSDMNQLVYSYDDMPAGQSDPSLRHFNLKPDESTVIPLLKEILTVDPSLKILATPWSAPAWMKTNDDVKGGSLKPADYKVYAEYLVRYLQGMQAAGIGIDAITMQNEPLNPKNTPSMVMTSGEQDQFLKSAFGPLMRSKGLKTKIILFDHNCNHPDYPISILADPQATQYAVGSGFHLYEGVISALSTVHDAFPAKNLYFTEQMVVDRPGATDLAIARSSEWLSGRCATGAAMCCSGIWPPTPSLARILLTAAARCARERSPWMEIPCSVTLRTTPSRRLRSSSVQARYGLPPAPATRTGWPMWHFALPTGILR